MEQDGVRDREYHLIKQALREVSLFHLDLLYQVFMGQAGTRPATLRLLQELLPIPQTLPVNGYMMMDC